MQNPSCASGALDPLVRLLQRLGQANGSAGDDLHNAGMSYHTFHEAALPAHDHALILDCRGSHPLRIRCRKQSGSRCHGTWEHGQPESNLKPPLTSY